MVKATGKLVSHKNGWMWLLLIQENAKSVPVFIKIYYIILKSVRICRCVYMYNRDNLNYKSFTAVMRDHLTIFRLHLTLLKLILKFSSF